jgi:dihydroorotase
MDQITITRPDDYHLHLRDGQYMADIVGYSARRFGRAIIMPNLKPPVTTVADALAYRERILMALPEGSRFEPLMTLYLTDNTTRGEVYRASKGKHILGFKLYPAGATTNSDAGVTDMEKSYPALEAMEEYDVPLLVHGEVTDPSVDVFDREAVFIDRVSRHLVVRFPKLRIVHEHITTAHAVDFVRSLPGVYATITAHHLLLNRNALFQGGIRPHHYCLPVLKRETHRQALLAAATSGNPKFFLGTDSAPHLRNLKEAACGCAGIFTAHAGIELYAEAFEAADALDKLEGFASHFGADFYDLPRNTSTITLVCEAWEVPGQLPFGDHLEGVVPLRGGEMVQWKLQE